VRKTAFDLQAAMQAKMRSNGQIDTGFMVNSVYVRTFDESTYGRTLTRKTTASKKTGKLSKRQGRLLVASADMMDEVERPPNNKTAYIAVAAPYGFWQNYGTHKQPARPFLEPSVDLVRPDFEAALAAIDAKLQAVR
jgi:phage gpG-like protein